VGTVMDSQSSTEWRSVGEWFFVAASDARARRPTDVAIGVLGALLVFVTALKSDQIEWAEEFFTQLVSLLPPWLGTAFTVVYSIGFIYALIIAVMAVIQREMRRDLVRDLGIAIGLSLALVFLLTRLVSGAWPVLLPELADQASALYPVARVAVVSAVLVVSGPELVLPFRRAGWLIVALMLMIAVALGYGLPSDAAGGLGIGFVAASVVLVGFGSARGFPDINEVRLGLRALGVEVTDLTVAHHQSWGARTFKASTAEDGPARVRVYGRDAKDARRVTIWWRSIWYRDSGPALTSSRLHQVEHEALLTIVARNAGVPAPRV
jgi:hypothetical protein